MDHLNGLSNYGAHPKAFDPEQVKPVLSNLSIIIKWYLKYKDSQTISKVRTGEEQAIGKIRIGEEQTVGKIKTEEVFKSFQIEGSFKEENIFQIIDSLSQRVKNSLLISKLEQGIRSDYQTFTSTSSPEAYRYFIYGMNAYYKRVFPTAVKLYSQAVVIDSNFTFAYINLSYAYFNLRSYEQAKKWCLKIYEKEDQMSMQQKIWPNRAYALFFETPYEEIKYVRQLQEIDDQLPLNYYSLGWIYNKLYQYDKAIPEYEKALEIYNKWGSKPVWDANYTGLGLAYHKTDQYKKDKKLYNKAELDFPDDPPLISRQAILALTEGDTISGNDYIKKYISLRKEGSASEAVIE